MKLEELIREIRKINEFPNTNFKWGKVNDPQKFISLNISYLQANSGKKIFLPYYQRLLEFYKANK
jgi:hypothetical protein